MLQLIIVLACLTVVLVYVIRHYVKVLRSDTPTCSGCSGCCDGPSATCDESAGAKSTTGRE